MNLRHLFERLMPRGIVLERAPAQPVKTVVSVVYTTAAKTFTGPAVYVTAGSPAMTSRDPDSNTTPTDQQAQPQQTDSSAAATSQPVFPTSTEDPSSAMPTQTSLTSTDPSLSSTSPSSVSTPPPSTSQSALSVAANHPSDPSATKAAASATASPTSTQGGMSGGAKAGLAFGVILGLGLVVAIVIFLYRRQKQKHSAHQRLDDEKAMATRPDALPMHPEPEPAVTPRSSGPAPRLSLRPVTQFEPILGGDRKSTAANAIPASASAPNLLMPAAAASTVAAATAAHKPANGIAPTPKAAATSAWERPGANNAVNDPANPFGNHAETLSSSPPNDAPIKEKVTPPSAEKPLPTPATPAPAMLAPKKDVDPTDFPLPLSAPPSPKPLSTQADVGNQAPTHAATGPAGVGAAAAAATAVKSPPKSPAPSAAESNVHRVQMDFVPSMDDELSIRTGQLVKIQHEYDDGWALVSYMDNSRSGVVPRTCLSKNPLKPRSPNAPPAGRPHMRGPPVGPAMQPPRPLTPGSGRNSPGPYAQAPRPHTPTGRNSPGPYAQAPRPHTPTGRNSPAPYAQPARPTSPYGQGRPASPMTRPRASSNTSYVAYNPNSPRSMSPGPYGAGGLKPTPRPDAMRRRSNSMGQITAMKNNPSAAQAPIPLNQMPPRKPVGAAVASDAPAP